jgi:hypothetical protein
LSIKFDFYLLSNAAKCIIYFFQGVTKVTNHLLSKKVGHTFLVLINLRNDCAIEIDGTTYSIRDSTLLEEPITHPLLNNQELEVCV